MYKEKCSWEACTHSTQMSSAKESSELLGWFSKISLLKTSKIETKQSFLSFWIRKGIGLSFDSLDHRLCSLQTNWILIKCIKIRKQLWFTCSFSYSSCFSWLTLVVTLLAPLLTPLQKCSALTRLRHVPLAYHPPTSLRIHRLFFFVVWSPGPIREVWRPPHRTFWLPLHLKSLSGGRYDCLCFLALLLIVEFWAQSSGS